VLDWGVARALADHVHPGGPPSAVQPDAMMAPIKDDSTEVGTVLGTPAYMAPEQLAGDRAGPAADIYALGCILYEILVGKPAHAHGRTGEAGQPVARPSKHRPDAPPELDAICERATQVAPAARFESARALGDAVQAYLDGDRDVARRQTMAVDLVWAARAMLDEGRRAESMRAAGRALALDPESSEAAQLITALVLEPPKQPPPELEATLDAAEAAGVRKHAKTAIGAYLAIASFLPIAWWNGVRRWDVVLAVFFVSLTMAIFAWRTARNPDRSTGAMLLYALGNVALLAALSRMAGPFTFVPGLACVITMSVVAYPVFTRNPAVLILLLLVGILGPIALELAGLFSKTWEIRQGELISHAGALRIEGTPTVIMIMIASVVTIVIAGVHSAGIAKASRTAQQQLVTQAWHLQQLLPTTSGSILTPWPEPA